MPGRAYLHLRRRDGDRDFVESLVGVGIRSLAKQVFAALETTPEV
jgi:hypothetical protein